MSLKNNDLKTLIEFVNMKDDSIKSELVEEIRSSKDYIRESVKLELMKEISESSQFRGPVGYSGKDGENGPVGPEGEQGPQGPQGPKGDAPSVQLDEINKKVRFQIGTLLSEDTGQTVAQYTDWIDLNGEKGDQGPAGPEGAQGEKGTSIDNVRIYENNLWVHDSVGKTYDLGPVVGPKGEQGPQGPIGEALTFNQLTEAQRLSLSGPAGPMGPKGEPGRFPLVDTDPENRRVRFQISEDVAAPWGDWIDIPEGPTGPQGEKGEPFLYEDLTTEQMYAIQGAQGAKGDTGARGLPGRDGKDGKDGKDGRDGKDLDPADVEKRIKKGVEPVAKRVTALKTDVDKKVNEIKGRMDKDQQATDSKISKYDQQIEKNFGEIRSFFSNRVDEVLDRNRINEMIVPLGYDGGNGALGAVFKEAVGYTRTDIINGSLVYMDNTIKASIRGDTYNPDQYLVYADASAILQAADGMVIMEDDGQVNLYTHGKVLIRDKRVIAGMDHLIPGEYYYLAHPGTSGITGQITHNRPTYGIAQIIGQAVDSDYIYLDISNEPIELDKTPMKIQGYEASRKAIPATSRGVEGDVFGDMNWDDNYLYFCKQEWDGTTDIWSRIAIQSNSW